MARIRFRKVYLLSIFLGMILLFFDLTIFFGSRFFLPLLIISLIIATLHFWIDFFAENKRQKQIEVVFLEFIRNLAESVKSGVSIPKSIVNVSKKDYRELNPYVQKLANQIEWGITTKKALETFAEDTNNRVIKRSVSIMIEAERSGGDIRDILSSIVDSVVSIKKMRAERKASVYSQIVQGYIIFFVFIAIMLVLQLWLFPKLTGIETASALKAGVAGIGGLLAGTGKFNLDPIFFWLVIIQGFFAGIMIGKFSEGSIKNGLLHSLILMVSAALLITTIKGTI
tara:strand:- start:7654 stop:8505 length:852 start_codon:yes stop_codon:yes gene_type:complete